MNNAVYIHKRIDIDDVVLQNVLFDAFISCGYTDASARVAAQKVVDIPHYVEYNIFTGIKVTKKRMLAAISRYIANNDDKDIELICDNAREILCSIPA